MWLRWASIIPRICFCTVWVWNPWINDARSCQGLSVLARLSVAVDGLRRTPKCFSLKGPKLILESSGSHASSPGGDEVLPDCSSYSQAGGSSFKRASQSVSCSRSATISCDVCLTCCCSVGVISADRIAPRHEWRWIGTFILKALRRPYQGVHNPPPPEQRFSGVGDAAADTVRVPWLADGPSHFFTINTPGFL